MYEGVSVYRSYQKLSSLSVPEQICVCKCVEVFHTSRNVCPLKYAWQNINHWLICPLTLRQWGRRGKVNTYRTKNWCQFHQNFTLAFFVRKCFFCQSVTRENHFHTKNLHVKCWWNWLLVPPIYYLLTKLIFVSRFITIKITFVFLLLYIV